MNPIDYLISTIETTSKLSLSQRENTFEKDGIIFCSVCNEPLQAWIKGPPDAEGNRAERLMPVICNCIKERERLAKEHQKRRDFERSLHDLRKIVGMRDYKTAHFEDDDAPDSKRSQTCRKYVEEFDKMEADNIGILFCGPAGTGKTFYAECIMNALADKGIYTACVPTSELVSRIQNRDAEEVFDAIGRFQLLVLDDIDAERSTSFGLETVYNIVNTRYKRKLPTIFTTNLSLKELQNEKDTAKNRINDRIIEMCPIKFKMNGISRRDTKSLEAFYKIKRAMTGETDDVWGV